MKNSKKIGNNRYRLKPNEERLILDYRLKNDNEIKSYISIGCVHVPFQNKELTNGILELMEDNEFNGIIIGGDFLDMGALGQYERGKINHTGVTLKDEYDAGNELLDEFDKRLGDDALKVYLYGNHEDRYWRWLADVNNNKLGAVLSPTNELFLNERGYDVYDNYANDVFKLGELNIIHGEYYNIHTAKKHADVFKNDTLFFHTHRMQMHNDGVNTAWNCGLVGDINSQCFNYAKRGMRMQWANGFAIINVNVNNDQHYVEQITVNNNKFVYNGKEY